MCRENGSFFTVCLNVNESSAGKNVETRGVVVGYDLVMVVMMMVGTFTASVVLSVKMVGKLLPMLSIVFVLFRQGFGLVRCSDGYILVGVGFIDDKSSLDVIKIVAKIVAVRCHREVRYVVFGLVGLFRGDAVIVRVGFRVTVGVAVAVGVTVGVICVGITVGIDVVMMWG